MSSKAQSIFTTVAKHGDRVRVGQVETGEAMEQLAAGGGDGVDGLKASCIVGALILAVVRRGDSGHSSKGRHSAHRGIQLPGEPVAAIVWKGNEGIFFKLFKNVLINSVAAMY